MTGAVLDAAGFHPGRSGRDHLRVYCTAGGWLRNLLQDYAIQGRTVLFSSQALPEVEQLAERVVIVNRGRLARTGQLAELTAGQGGLEPLLSHIASLSSWTLYLPGVAADSLTQDIQNGVRLLSPWAGGLVLAGWAVAFVIAGVMITERTGVT